MKTLAEKLGISLKDIGELKQTKDFKFPDFTQFRLVKSEGSSEEILEWKDSFVEPLDSSTLENYYQNPELFYQDALRRMRELFLGVCRFMQKYSEGVVERELSEKERGGALLLALHLFFDTCDIIWKYDRLLETRDPKVSPLGKIYQDIRDAINKAAAKRGYDEAWVEKTSNLLFSSPEYESPSLLLFSDSLSLMRKYPSLERMLEKNKGEILSEIENHPELYEEIEKVGSKHNCEPYGVIDVLLSLKSNPKLVESFKEQKKSGAEKIGKILKEIRTSLSPQEFERLEEARRKVRWFMDTQETNAIIISKNKTSMGALGMLFTAIKGYFKENLDSFVKEQHRGEIKEILSSLFEKDLARGEYYFLPSLRKLAYQLIKMNFVKDEYRRIYEEEIQVWTDP